MRSKSCRPVVLSRIAPMVVIALAVAGLPASGQNNVQCPFGTYLGGYPVQPDETFCGFVACGADDFDYVCETDGWHYIPSSSSCRSYNAPSVCNCPFGSYFGGLPVDPDDTYCGFTVCGGDDFDYVCEADGWHYIPSSAPCSTDHHKLGVNTAAVYVDPNGNAGAAANLDRAQALGMGAYLEIDNERDGGEGVVHAMQQAMSRGLTPILRICVDTKSAKDDGLYPCDFASASDFVDHIRGIDNALSGKFYVIAGANEPDKELWIAGENQHWIDDDKSLDATEIDKVGLANATYMNRLIDDLGAEGRTLRTGGEIGLLSPAFDCLNTHTERIIQAMAAHGAEFDQLDGLAVNVYDVDSQTATQWLTQCQSFFRDNGIEAPISNVFITETGMVEIDNNQTPRTDALIRWRGQYLALKGNPTVREFLLFGAFGTNSDFSYNVLQDDAEWDYIRGGNGAGTTSCSCTGPNVVDNFCHHLPRTPDCPMTFPGGYCDPNGNSQYEDADWVLGFIEYQANCS